MFEDGSAQSNVPWQAGVRIVNELSATFKRRIYLPTTAARPRHSRSLGQGPYATNTFALCQARNARPGRFVAGRRNVAVNRRTCCNAPTESRFFAKPTL